MKESKYNIYLEHNKKQVVFNSRTTATAFLDDEAIELLRSIRDGEKDISTALAFKMKEVGFLVDNGINELQQLEMEYYFSKYGKSGLSLVIAPTMACNFACPYCYESEQMMMMLESIQRKVISLVKQFAKEGQSVYITWFGGEPLLTRNIIYDMSEKMLKICQQEKVDYEAEIITNGYLLDEETVDNLKKYKIKFVQVTIDGMPETHNKRRRLKACREGSTFGQIFKNIIYAKSNGLDVAVRISVDRQTVGELEQVLDLMIENELGEDVYLGRIEGNTDECKSCSSICLNDEEYARVCSNFEKLKLKKGLTTEYPTPVRTNCGAGYQHAYVIDVEGYMYKCWNDIGIKGKSVGNIDEYTEIVRSPNMNYSKWMSWSPFKFRKCEDCKILPICMGGCQYNGQNLGEPICEDWKFELEEYIKLKCDGEHLQDRM